MRNQTHNFFQSAAVVVALFLASIPSFSQEEVKDSSWEGKWYRNNYFAGGELWITDQSNGSCYVSITVFNGTHSGYIETHATISGDTATILAKVEGMRGDSCVIRIIRRKNDVMWIEEEGLCSYYRGARVSFSGKFKPERPGQPTLRDLGIMSWWQEQKFKKLTGDLYNDFIDVASDIQDIEGGYQLGIPGLYTLSEAIILIDKWRKFKAAIIVTHADLTTEVHYFSNDKDYIDKLPPKIEEWRSRFDEYPVVYRNQK